MVIQQSSSYIRLQEHITSSQKRETLYRAIRASNYDCFMREVNTFHSMEEALEWEKKLIKRIKDKRLNVSWGGEYGENNKRRWVPTRYYKETLQKEK